MGDVREPPDTWREVAVKFGKHWYYGWYTKTDGWQVYTAASDPAMVKPVSARFQMIGAYGGWCELADAPVTPKYWGE